MSLKPGIIGLSGIILSTAEANLFDHNGGLYHQPDGLMFDPTTMVLYNIEYKCNDGHPQKARKQLIETSEQLKNLFSNYKVINLHITDDYHIHEVR